MSTNQISIFDIFVKVSEKKIKTMSEITTILDAEFDDFYSGLPHIPVDNKILEHINKSMFLCYEFVTSDGDVHCLLQKTRGPQYIPNEGCEVSLLVVQKIMVRPSKWHTGKATAVITAIEKVARAHNLSVMFQSILSKEMINLAEKLGYRPSIIGSRDYVKIIV